MSRERRRRGDPESVGDLIGRVGSRIGLDTDVVMLLADAPRWASVVGDDLARSGAPVSCRDGELVLAAVDALSAARLTYAAGAICACVNEHLGRAAVRRVVVRARD